MRLVIAAIGKMRPGPDAELLGLYRTRADAIGRNIGFTGPDIAECETSAHLPPNKKREKESAVLLAAAPTGAQLVRLDERGKSFTSKDFAAFLSERRDDGTPALCFLIGGADGHDPSLARVAPLSLSFGAATWPHMLVRVMLTEQIYRAMTLLTGHPYHRA